MYRNRCNNEVRPFIVEVPIGKRGAALIGLHSMLGQSVHRGAPDIGLTTALRRTSMWGRKKALATAPTK